MKTIRFDIITIFPGMFDSPFRESILNRAQQEGRVTIAVHDLRAYTLDKHGRVDDYPFLRGLPTELATNSPRGMTSEMGMSGSIAHTSA